MEFFNLPNFSKSWVIKHSKPSIWSLAMVDQVTQGCIVAVNTPEMIIKQCLDKTENINCDNRILVQF
jgi:hypothetical protein